ncbi:LpxL/LpxP family acyltransferase [Pseudochryseolinea flava]|uniref:Lipid A biosynthesis acyltransferase n=1 Tax=Pseudochryseolinea flava TaxID=2059302 RepID=A0A364Y2F2_9BACT|nr:lipid A biosynthesis acyltransferase [Pseudochryseolinea flava]RAW00140.1 lipid A biosynthesis acyltransferase [Pseudochryseolinea flava]
MPEWQGKSRGNKLGYKIFIVVCNTVGLKPAYLLLRFVALYYFLFSRKSSTNIYQYFRHRLKFSWLKSVVNVYRNYYRFGQTLLDKIVVSAGMSKPFTFHFDGEENLQEFGSIGKGGILLSAHVGNWEVAGNFLQRLNTRVNVVMFDGEHQQIKEYIDEVTGGKKFHIIVIKEDMSHVYAIAEALQRNEVICIHADRFLPGNKTKRCRFLGEDASFPLGPFQIAAGFSVPVAITFAFKETASHYHFFGGKPMQRLDDESKAMFSERLLTTFVSDLETKIKMYPEQWFNYYNFWQKE